MPLVKTYFSILIYCRMRQKSRGFGDITGQVTCVALPFYCLLRRVYFLFLFYYFVIGKGTKNPFEEEISKDYC